MKVPVKMEMEIPDYPSPFSDVLVVKVCQNDGCLIYEGKDGLTHEARGGFVHSCNLIASHRRVSRGLEGKK